MGSWIWKRYVKDFSLRDLRQCQNDLVRWRAILKAWEAIAKRASLQCNAVMHLIRHGTQSKLENVVDSLRTQCQKDKYATGYGLLDCRRRLSFSGECDGCNYPPWKNSLIMVLTSRTIANYLCAIGSLINHLCALSFKALGDLLNSITIGSTAWGLVCGWSPASSPAHYGKKGILDSRRVSSRLEKHWFKAKSI